MEPEVPFLTICALFPLSGMQMERERLSSHWPELCQSLKQVWKRLFRNTFLRFQGIFLCLFTKDMNRLEQNEKSFG